MNFKKIILISLILVLAIGAVNAEDTIIEDVNDNNLNLDDYEIAYDEIISYDTLSSTEYEITDENYEEYFNITTGEFLANSTIVDGDIINVNNVSNKHFVINKSLTVNSIKDNVLNNISIYLVSGSDGTIINNLNIFNEKGDYSLIIEDVSNIDVNNCIFNVSSGIPISLSNANNITIKNNNIYSIKNDSLEINGIYIESSSNIEILNNVIEVLSGNVSYTNAITADKVSNLTISKNNINVYGEIKTFSVVVSNSENIFIDSNNITTLASEKNIDWSFWPDYEIFSVGMHIYRNDNTAISNNNLYMGSNGLTPENLGTIENILIDSSNNTLIDSNSIVSNGTKYVYGLKVAGYFDMNNFDYYKNINTTISNNEFYTISGHHSNGFTISSLTEYTNIFNNQITVIADNFTYGAYFENDGNGPTYYNDFYNNYITAISNYAVGIQNYGPRNSKFHDNFINTSGNTTRGIEIFAGTWNNEFNNNIIYSLGSNENSTGIQIGQKNDENIKNNVIFDNYVRTNAEYSVVILNGSTIKDNNVTFNDLRSNSLMGDNSVKGNNTTNLIENNFYSLNTSLNGSDISILYKNDTQYVVTLIDENGNILANKTITFIFDGQITTAITNDEGKAYLTISKDVGTYEVTVLFNGTANYTSSNITNTITVLPTINGSDVKKYYKNGTQFEATIVGSDGTPLAYANVTIVINGVSYNRTADENGSLKFSINLAPGNYALKITNLADNVSMTYNVTVLSTVFADNVTLFYCNGSKYGVSVIDGEGNPIVGCNVSLNINGVFYDRTTDVNGTAWLNINLDPGTYTITAIHPISGLEIGNVIKVLPTLESEDLVMFYRNGSKYGVTVYDKLGNPIVGRNVSLNINGVFYNRTTDVNGTAWLNINLDPGNYTITAEHPVTGLKLGNNIEVRPTVFADDLTKKFGTNDTYDIHVLDGQGKPVNNVNVTININGVMYERTTGSDGIVKLNINLDPNTYIATIMYKGYETSNIVTVNA
ncbi:hypothetical protein [Methanobrevibacter sp. DSM 116169]|uniref:hypothetical protein n=1 Tax=Methanobrevibacter sp. DSM 116169 TaxID=3242727 RepID=UPI0038FC8140